MNEMFAGFSIGITLTLAVVWLWLYWAGEPTNDEPMGMTVGEMQARSRAERLSRENDLLRARLMNRDEWIDRCRAEMIRERPHALITEGFDTHPHIMISMSPLEEKMQQYNYLLKEHELHDELS